jgi:alkylation response protein AidB-like acyl-CoA dehydrogenase
MADFGGDIDAFRADARAWLEANFPASLKGKGGMMYVEGANPEGDDIKAWTRVMGEKGWGVPTWPKAYGGGGLSQAEARVLQQEMGRVGAWNPIGGMGTMMFGPTLLEYGNEEQKKTHIPAIAKQEVRWCQGFSEPGAGSDLASLQTKAEDKGDHFLVNGQKIWTSGAQWADMCFCLVRTDTTKKHEGISFLLIDMHDPGVEVRPIKLIAGASPFCETFFTNVKVPKENLVGPLNGGWTIAKRLLQHERNGLSGGGGGGGGMFGVGGSPSTLAKSYVGADEKGRIADTDIRARVTSHEMDAKAFQLTAFRMMAEAKSNQGPTTTTSIMKNAGTKVGQDRAELILEIMGTQGLGWEGEGFKPEELAAVRGWLGGKATTIFGGSAEIQNNIISKRILGLPDPLGSSSN